MEAIIMKTCKTCMTEKEIKKFSGRSAVCSVCVYSTKKDKLKDYYIKNKEEIIKRVLEVYHFKHDDIPKKKQEERELN